MVGLKGKKKTQKNKIRVVGQYLFLKEATYIQNSIDYPDKMFCTEKYVPLNPCSTFIIKTGEQASPPLATES